LMSLYFNENTRQFEEESNADQLKNIPDFFWKKRGLSLDR
jgi:hypothetical protein